MIKIRCSCFLPIVVALLCIAIIATAYVDLSLVVQTWTELMK